MFKEIERYDDMTHEIKNTNKDMNIFKRTKEEV